MLVYQFVTKRWLIDISYKKGGDFHIKVQF